MLERRLSIILVGAVLALVLLGGIVHNTGSSLACPDWPLCYGSLMPKMEGGVAIEHTHRLFASSVGLLSIILATVLWRRRPQDRLLRILSLSAVALVVFQGILGGVTVIFRLPTIVSTAHLATSMIFFATVIVMALRTNGIPLAFRKSSLLKLTIIFVYLQMVLGAVVRHTHSGLVCPEFPLCYSSLWPTGMGGMVLLQMAHRIGAVMAAGLVLLTCHLLWRRPEFAGSRWRPLLLAAPMIVILQFILGIVSVTTLLGVVPVTAHLAGAALLWASLITLEVVA